MSETMEVHRVVGMFQENPALKGYYEAYSMVESVVGTRGWTIWSVIPTPESDNEWVATLHGMHRSKHEWTRIEFNVNDPHMLRMKLDMLS